MKPLLVVLGLIILLPITASATALTRPAQGLRCTAIDNTDFKFELIVNRFNGDLYPNTFILSDAGKPIPTTIKQFSNYSNEITLVASTGPEGEHDDVGYIIAIRKTYRGDFSGRATKYIANPPGTREEQEDTSMSLECEDMTL